MSQQDLGASLLKAFGNAFTTHGQRTRYFSTGFPPLNKIISGSYNGGIPSGRIVEISGASQTGKTMLATQIMKAVQEAGGAALYCDHERRFVPEIAAGRGMSLDAPQFVWVKPRTWEDSCSTAVKFARMIRDSKEFDANAPIIAVIDSVAAANPRSKMEEKKGEDLSYTMSDTTALARATSTTLPVLAQFCDELDLTLLLLNQTRDVPGVVYGPKTTSPGGKAISFYADVRLELTKSMERDGQDVIGQYVNAKATKALTAPYQKVSWLLRFLDTGETIIDLETSLVDYLVDKEIITSPTKGYIEYNGEKFRKKAFIEAIKTSGKYQSLVDHLIALENQAAP